MLAKGMGYFCDAEAVAEQVSEASLARVAQGSFSSQRGGDKDYALTVSRNRSERRVLENFAARAAAGTATRNPRSFALLGPEPLREAHYAAMPTALVEPLLLASTSARGVCRACGAPWARIVERAPTHGKRDFDGKMLATDPQNGQRRLSAGARAAREAGLPHDQPFAPARTLGFRATCTCAAGEPVPATILDPFAGSGTVGLVAVRHRRRAILCDLSQTYLRDIADARTRNVQVELELA